MNIKIITDDLSDPRIAIFLNEHIREMRSVSPPESTHALDLDGLRKPEITFWSAWNNDELIGCGAIKRLTNSHAEIKSMRTSRKYRRNGIASILLKHIINESIKSGFRKLSLETGSMKFFEPARALYKKHGFKYCEPFNGYKKDPNSVFMTLEI